MDRYRKIAGRLLRYGLVAGMLMFTGQPAYAASVSFFLDQSNKLPDGTNYLSVMLTENDSGGIDFLVKTLAPLNEIAGSNFGIQKFGFGLSNGLFEEITDLPDGWKVKYNKRMDGFGRFDFRLQGKGWARTKELSFKVSDVSLGNFDPLFAAQVAGFEWCHTDDERRSWCGGKDCARRAYFAGSMPGSEVPVPAAVWLFGSGLAGLIGISRRRSANMITK